MNEEDIAMLESWAKSLYREHDDYWKRPYKEIMADKIKNADEFGFLPCHRCRFRMAFGRPFIHLGLADPDWDGTGDIPSGWCIEHEVLLKEYMDLPMSHPDFHNLALWRDRWNEQVSQEAISE